MAGLEPKCTIYHILLVLEVKPINLILRKQADSTTARAVLFNAQKSVCRDVGKYYEHLYRFSSWLSSLQREIAMAVSGKCTH